MSYIKAAQENNFDCVLMNHRAGGGVDLTSPCLYHCGTSPDLEEVVEHVYKTKCQGSDRRIFCIGSSLGAGIITKYLERLGEKSKVSAAFCLSPHFNSFKAMGYLNRHCYGAYDVLLG
mmetsp:Transcript_1910/g.1355  ORF Transcript_1910/g.1355 Transcript_1910/m.1355 type:complete len:118 (-) Transcript_1910:414-767(-)